MARAADLRSQAGQPPHPADLAILAMTHFKLGHGDEARVVLGRLRELMEQKKKAPAEAGGSEGGSEREKSSDSEKNWAKGADAKALYKEAAGLIEGQGKVEEKNEGKPEDKAERK